MKQINDHFTIQQVSELLELPKSTIRYWETEFASYICPQRTRGGQRRYCQEDIACIRKIQTLKMNGLTLPEIKSRIMGDATPYGNLDGLDIEKLTKRIIDAVRTEIFDYFSQTNTHWESNDKSI